MGDRERVDLDACLAYLPAELRERARAVGKADGELVDEHGETP